MSDILWKEVIWPRPFEPDTALVMLTHLASVDRRGPLVFEARAVLGSVRYFLGAEPPALRLVSTLISSEVRGARFAAGGRRGSVAIVRHIKLSHPSLALNTKNTLAVIRASLASLARTRHSGDETVLQIILGRPFTPSLLPGKLSDPKATWLDIIRGTVAPATRESRASLHERAGYHGFETVIRIGASSDSAARATENLRALFSGLKVAESMGVRMSAAPDRDDAVDEVKRPWHFPLRLSVRELLGLLCWPLGEEEFSGVAGLHPKPLPAPRWLADTGRGFGKSEGGEVTLGISARDSLEHTAILGPTGSGKSTAMLSLIMADVNAGRSVLVIDPKSDLIGDILSRIPSERENDVVVLDPSDPLPAGLNPLVGTGRTPLLTADAILAVFQGLFADSWGVYTQDILSAALLTLTQTKGASLLWLPPLLTDEVFRNKITRNIPDQIGLGAFWAGFENMSPSQRNQATAPVMNKVRRFLLRPELRGMLGQAEPKFSMMDIFYKRRIVLVPLNKGMIGHESARLLGSLIVGQLWTMALSRAGIPAEKRHIVSVFIDEVQDYLRLPTDLSDALAQARGLGVGLTVAFQYRNQLPADLRAGIDANARNKIVFGLTGSDAKDMAAMAPELDPVDFMTLPRFAVYASLRQNGKSTGWISGKTMPPAPAHRSAHEVKAVSMAAYGREIREVEREYMAALGHRDAETGSGVNDDGEHIGRKKREASK
jgi:hypothetical protein